ncbi:hypothetical protein BDN67DRAFT_976261 [Paxillus ammoniavirescens]|nr:hypothetical protein BDN67DRAFT_976261 [Paxillus ammoniavirescens]
MDGSKLSNQCIMSGWGTTRCQYKLNNTGGSLWCYFNSNGKLDGSFHSSDQCKGSAGTSNTCPKNC